MTEQLGVAGFEDLRADYESQYEQLRANLESLQKRMEEVAETAHSSDGLVAATVGARGELRELVLDPRIYRTTDAKALADTILQTIRAAMEGVTARMMELAKPLLPEGVLGAEGKDSAFDSVLRKLTGQDGDS